MKEIKWADFPVEEYQGRWTRASKLMEEQNIDALILTQQENVRYFSGYKSILWGSKFRPLVVVLPKDGNLGASLILPGQERGNSLTSWIEDVLLYRDQVDPIPLIASVFEKKKLGRGVIGAELGFGQRLGMTFHQLGELKAKLPDARFVGATRLIQDVRMVKSPAEVDCLRKACEISQKGVRAGWESLRPGMTEKELMAIMVSTLFREGAEAGVVPSFLGIRGGRERNMVGNGVASDAVIQKGDFVMIDGGACYNGYVCDFIRMAYLGEPSKDKMELFQLAVQANDAAKAAIKPGVTGADVYEAAMRVFEEAGVARFNVQNIVGHGVGMDVHEIPWLGERNAVYTSDVILQPGMCLCVEPVVGKTLDVIRDRLTKSTFVGLKDIKETQDPPEIPRLVVEDVVVVTKNGCENLTQSLNKELWLIP